MSLLYFFFCISIINSDLCKFIGINSILPMKKLYSIFFFQSSIFIMQKYITHLLFSSYFYIMEFRSFSQTRSIASSMTKVFDIFDFFTSIVYLCKVIRTYVFIQSFIRIFIHLIFDQVENAIKN